MTNFVPSFTAVAVVVLALFGTVQAGLVVFDYSPQQLHDLWAAAAAATPSHDPDAPISGVTVTLTGTPVRPTSAVAATIPAITGRPRFPPFLPPWLTGGLGAGGTLPPGWGTGPLTAGAVCGPYTLPVNLPFSPPCPYSTTKAVTTSKETEPTPPTVPAPPPTAPTIPFPPAVPISESTTIHPSSHSLPTVSPPSASPPVPSESPTLSVSSSLATPTPRTTDTTTTSTPIIKTLPPTTVPAASSAVSGSPTQVIVTVSVTLRPDPPYTPGPRRGGPATTLATVRRE